MKKIQFWILSVFLLGISLTMCKTTAHAYHLSSDGHYTLVMHADDGDIDGQPYYKAIRFDFDAENEQVKLSDLTNGITAFNGQHQFTGWKRYWNDTAPLSGDTLLTPNDFTWSGEYGNISYTNGLNIYAHFDLSKPLSGTGTYYVILDSFGGTVNGQESIRLTENADSFTGIDLSKYTAQREGYQFVGWGYNGRIVTTIDNTYFTKGDAITVTALYKKLTYTDTEEDRYILKLDANGGTIDGNPIQNYNYTAATSAAEMPIFHYVPERKGYRFKGWNTKKMVLEKISAMYIGGCGALMKEKIWIEIHSLNILTHINI